MELATIFLLAVVLLLHLAMIATAVIWYYDDKPIWGTILKWQAAILAVTYVIVVLLLFLWIPSTWFGK